MDFIFEVREAEDDAGPVGLMQHPFIPYLPEQAEAEEQAVEEYKQPAAAAYLNGDDDELADELGDIELGFVNEQPAYKKNEVCFIC